VFVLIEIRNQRPFKVVRCYDTEAEARSALPLYQTLGRDYDVRPWREIEQLLNPPRQQG
jgi:hypothetical protein